MLNSRNTNFLSRSDGSSCILLWNSMSLEANGQEFYKIVLELLETPNLICIQEIWLKWQFDCVRYWYTTIRSHRQTRKVGLWKRGKNRTYMWYVLSQNRTWYNIMNVIKVWTDKHSVTISCHCVVYYHNPSNTPRTDILNDVGVPIRGNVGQNSFMWMKRLKKFINDHDFVYISNGKGTSYPNPLNQTKQL